MEIDQNLLEAAQEGDPAAGPMLVSQFAPALVTYLQVIAPSRGLADVEELAQIAIERAVARLPQFDPTRATFAGWLRGFARTVLLEAAGTRPATISIDDLALASPESERPAESDEAAESAASEALTTVLAGLGETDQLIIALRINEQLPYEAIAQKLGVAVGACRVRYLRAVRRLRESAQDVPALRGHWFGSADHE